MAAVSEVNGNLSNKLYLSIRLCPYCLRDTGQPFYDKPLSLGLSVLGRKFLLDRVRQKLSYI